jgi:hypothetical protein
MLYCFLRKGGDGEVDGCSKGSKSGNGHVHVGGEGGRRDEGSARPAMATITA